MDNSMENAASTRALIDSNAREAADLVGELTLMLDHASHAGPELQSARLITRRIADRLGQVMTLSRLSANGGVCADAYSPLELLEELEHEAIALAAGRIEVRVGTPRLVPQCWFFDRELLMMALSNAVHSALSHARRAMELTLEVKHGYLGFSVVDDAGAFPAVLVDDEPERLERGEANGNALGIYFARRVAHLHRNGDRYGRLELSNRTDGAGTCLTLWLP
jgi:signal transduction histidine kinase